MRRFKLFGTAFEYLDLFLSIALTSLAIYEVVYSPLTLLSGKEWTLLQDIFFLKNGHVVFTFLFLFNTRQGHAWLDQSHHPFFLLRASLVLVGGTIGGLIITFLPGTAISSFAQFIFIFAGKHHQLQQCRGIQRIYESKYASSVFKETPSTKMLFSLDALIWYGLSSASSVALYMSQLRRGEGRFVVSETIIDPISKTSLGLTALFLVLLAARAFICYRDGLGVRINIRNLRFLPLVLVEHSDVAKFASAALHGVESAGVMNHLDSRTDRILSRAIMPALLSGGMFVIIFLHYPYLFFPDLFDASSFSWWGFFPPIVAGISFLHFFIDSQIFSGSLHHSRRFVLSRLTQ